MNNNGTMAVWCVPRPGSNPTDLEVHFNYWHIDGDDRARGKSAHSDFVEVGLMVTDIAQIDRICIYVPAAIDRSDIEDCAPYLAKGEFAQGIFNEVLATTASVPGGTRCVVLLDHNGSIFCRAHQFAMNGNVIDSGELDVMGQNDGTVLSITRAAVNAACLNCMPPARSYFRLRFHLARNHDLNPFVKIIPTPDRLLQSGFDEIEYLDFRVNEVRTLPTPIESRMKSDGALGGAVRLKLVAFLTAVPVHSELTVSNTPSHKMRLLEHSLWNRYAAGIPNGMVVYHWKREDEPNRPLTDFSAFVKLETRRSSRWILAKYLAIAFGIGLLGNFTASALQFGFTNAWEYIRRTGPLENSQAASPPTDKSSAH